MEFTIETRDLKKVYHFSGQPGTVAVDGIDLQVRRGEIFSLVGKTAVVTGTSAGIGTRLARTLVLSGFGMTICGGSYPASQGEHLMPILDQISDQGPTHHPGTPGDCDPHVLARVGSERTVCQNAEM